jgi:hypothetical protein
MESNDERLIKDSPIFSSEYRVVCAARIVGKRYRHESGNLVFRLEAENGLAFHRFSDWSLSLI